MDNLGAVGGSIGEQYVQQNGNESNTVQEQGFDYDFNPTSEAESSTSLEDGIDELNNSGIADILTEENKLDPKIEAIKSRVLNKNGSMSFIDINTMYHNGIMTFEDFAQVFDAEIKEDEKGNNYFETNKGFKATCGAQSGGLTIYDNSGKQVDWASNPQFFTDAVERTPYYDDNNLPTYNADGSDNFERLGKAIEEGILDIEEFVARCDYNINDSRDQKLINYTRSNTFSFNLPDGTKVSGLASDWSNTLGKPFVHIETPDGKEYKFEYGSKK